MKAKLTEALAHIMWVYGLMTLIGVLICIVLYLAGVVVTTTYLAPLLASSAVAYSLSLVLGRAGHVRTGESKESQRVSESARC